MEKNEKIDAINAFCFKNANKESLNFTEILFEKEKPSCTLNVLLNALGEKKFRVVDAKNGTKKIHHKETDQFLFHWIQTNRGLNDVCILENQTNETIDNIFFLLKSMCA